MEQCANDFHMVQLMPPQLTPFGVPLLVPAYQGCPGKRARKTGASIY